MTESNDDTDKGAGEQERGSGQPAGNEDPSRRGSIRYQDPGSATPREPTLAEKRAMRRAEADEESQLAEATAEAERRAQRRRRIMIGSGVTVGVVATVAVWYAAVTPDEVTAHCVDRDSVLSSNEDYCSESYVSSHGGYHSGGFYYINTGGGGYSQYRYNYGGTVDRGTGRVSGGSTVAPSSGTRVKSTSGKTVQRGGFGVSGGGKSGGS